MINSWLKVAFDRADFVEQDLGVREAQEDIRQEPHTDSSKHFLQLPFVVQGAGHSRTVAA